MRQYLDLIQHILANGTVQSSRAILQSTHEHPDTISIFGYQMRFDLTTGFPLCTTKKVSFNNIATELCWMLYGYTNIGYLNDRGVHIWDQWADAAGELGPVYGRQWRHWNGWHDQISQLITDIWKVIRNPQDPAARRLLLTAWNPTDLPPVAPPACHTVVQFSIRDTNKLSCQLYQRSADVFLGLPYNIASYALLTHIIGALTGLEPYEFVHTMGDAHLYSNQIAAAKIILTRVPYDLPKLEIVTPIVDIDTITPEYFRLSKYRYHPAIRVEIAV